MSILQMSISAGVLVIAIVLIRAVALNRLPKKMFLVLWGVTLFRLLVPVSIPLPFGIPNIIDEISKAVLYDSAPPAIENPINTGETVIWIAEIPGAAGQLTESEQTHIFNISPTTIIWIVGMIAAFIFFAFIYFRNHRGLRYAMAIRDNDFLNEWLAEHKLLRPITIMQSDRIISPLAAEILKPRIILPKSMNMSDKQLLNYVLTHEYFHIKRYDALWKMILLLALCVHWFNPMVWLMFVLASRDLELTCDEAVIYRFGAKAKKDYACMLISMAEQPGKFAPLYNGFSRNATEERIVSIMKYKKSTITAIVLAVLLVVGATTVFAGNALTANNGNSGAGSFIDENGNKQSVTNGQINQARKFSLGDDETLTPAQNDDTLLDSYNINPFSFENNDALTGNNATYNFDKNANANTFDFSELRSKIVEEQDIITARTYTDEELARIIADIESGKIQPYIPNDSEDGIFYDG